MPAQLLLPRLSTGPLRTGGKATRDWSPDLSYDSDLWTTERRLNGGSWINEREPAAHWDNNATRIGD